MDLTLRTDSSTAAQAQQVFASLGIDLSTAVNVFFKQAIRYNGFPFEVRNPVPTEETLEALREAAAMKADPELGKTYDDVDEMMKELLS